MRSCLAGLKEESDPSRRAGIHSLIVGNGRGPDGSSLTTNSQRSPGNGVEKLPDKSLEERATTSEAWHLLEEPCYLLFREVEQEPLRFSERDLEPFLGRYLADDRY